MFTDNSQHLSEVIYDIKYYQTSIYLNSIRVVINLCHIDKEPLKTYRKSFYKKIIGSNDDQYLMILMYNNDCLIKNLYPSLTEFYDELNMAHISFYLTADYETLLKEKFCNIKFEQIENRMFFLKMFFK